MIRYSDLCKGLSQLRNIHNKYCFRKAIRAAHVYIFFPQGKRKKDVRNELLHSGITNKSVLLFFPANWYYFSWQINWAEMCNWARCISQRSRSASWVFTLGPSQSRAYLLPRPVNIWFQPGPGLGQWPYKRDTFLASVSLRSIFYFLAAESIFAPCHEEINNS